MKRFISFHFIIICVGVNIQFALLKALASEADHKTFTKSFFSFAKTTNADSDWLSQTSPWSPYFKTLAQHQPSKRLKALEQQGRCDEVMSEILRNFVKQVPSLSAAFLNPDILKNFERTLVPALSNRYKRCKAWQKLSYAIERSKRRNIFMAAPYLDLPHIGLQFKLREPKNKEKKFVYKALISLTHLGLCRNQTIALKDLQNLSEKMYVKIFDEPQSLYMDAHAKKLGVKTNHYEMIKNNLNHTKYKHQVSRDPQKVLSMQVRLQAGDLKGAKKLVPSLMEICHHENEKP